MRWRLSRGGRFVYYWSFSLNFTFNEVIAEGSLQVVWRSCDSCAISGSTYNKLAQFQVLQLSYIIEFADITRAGHQAQVMAAALPQASNQVMSWRRLCGLRLLSHESVAFLKPQVMSWRKMCGLSLDMSRELRLWLRIRPYLPSSGFYKVQFAVGF